MPHIHIELDQHDMTVSAYIITRENDEWKCLVHLHAKLNKLMQIGGHIETNETPWQAMAHEIEEESGYTLDALSVLMPSKDILQTRNNVNHPVPFASNTHYVGDGHYHSDSCYGFVAKNLPTHKPHEGESTDLRWLRLNELDEAAKNGTALQDVSSIYHWLINHYSHYEELPATLFSLEKPLASEVTYVTGSVSEQRN